MLLNKIISSTIFIFALFFVSCNNSGKLDEEYNELSFQEDLKDLEEGGEISSTVPKYFKSFPTATSGLEGKTLRQIVKEHEDLFKAIKEEDERRKSKNESLIDSAKKAIFVRINDIVPIQFDRGAKNGKIAFKYSVHNKVNKRITSITFSFTTSYLSGYNPGKIYKISKENLNIAQNQTFEGIAFRRYNYIEDEVLTSRFLLNTMDKINVKVLTYQISYSDGSTMNIVPEAI